MKDFPQAFKYLQEALQLQSEIGDQDGKIHTLLGLSQVGIESGRLKQASVFANEAIDIARAISDSQVGHGRGLADAVGNIGQVR